MKGKGFVLSVVFSLVTLAGQAQFFDEPVVEYPRSMVKLHLLMPGILWEKQMVDNATLVVDLATSFAFSYTNIGGNEYTSFVALPYVRIEPRVYLGLQKRAYEHKDIRNFSAQYLAFQARFGIKTGSVYSWQSYGPVFGLQRMIGNKGYIDFGAGLGLYQSGNSAVVGYIGNFGLGFILSSK